MAHIVQEQLLQAVVALLQAAPAVAETVQEARDTAGGFTGASVVNVSVPLSDPDAASLSNSPVAWVSQVQIDVEARATAGVTARATVSPIVAAIYARLMGDATLAAAGYYIEGAPTVAIDAIETEDRIGGARLTWRILHRSAWADLTVSA